MKNLPCSSKSCLKPCVVTTPLAQPQFRWNNMWLKWRRNDVFAGCFWARSLVVFSFVFVFAEVLKQISKWLVAHTNYSFFQTWLDLSWCSGSFSTLTTAHTLSFSIVDSSSWSWWPTNMRWVIATFVKQLNCSKAFGKWRANESKHKVGKQRNWPACKLLNGSGTCWVYTCS